MTFGAQKPWGYIYFFGLTLEVLNRVLVMDSLQAGQEVFSISS